ncbi:hypothetical protein MED217_10657 [Leeuwenhoekiella blandensis MED217]|jgi:hypothetical protein|uniref:Uncharacterized protein n=1 Tax=Leeuwenhoekiella blandensis (strain CECT 7118 / CCUG 51940 / KCTC 22103 / MED217) TaxID=398720 RepID=A3XN73_LEEBM|nr:hypothetical protein MED217_10657 [Leeuwenhoekiella blandensis MED217]
MKKRSFAALFLLVPPIGLLGSPYSYQDAAKLKIHF